MHVEVASVETCNCWSSLYILLILPLSCQTTTPNLRKLCPKSVSYSPLIPTLHSHEHLYFSSFKTIFNSSTTASPTSLVLLEPPISAVLAPFSIARLTASSTTLASVGRLREYCNIMATERIVPMGLTLPWPEMSGAEPAIAVSCMLYSESPLLNLPTEEEEEEEHLRRKITHHESVHKCPYTPFPSDPAPHSNSHSAVIQYSPESHSPHPTQYRQTDYSSPPRHSTSSDS